MCRTLTIILFYSRLDPQQICRSLYNLHKFLFFFRTTSNFIKVLYILLVYFLLLWNFKISSWIIVHEALISKKTIQYFLLERCFFNVLSSTQPRVKPAHQSGREKPKSKDWFLPCEDLSVEDTNTHSAMRIRFFLKWDIK